MTTLTAAESRPQEVQTTSSRRCANSSFRRTVWRPDHVGAQLLDLAAERAHDADARERLADPAVDVLDVLAHRAVNRPDAAREREADRHDAGDDRERRQRQPPVQDHQDGDGDRSAGGARCRRDHRHLQQAGRRFDVSGQPRQDAAGLHLPELRQRQVQQPIEQRPAQREHHAGVQQPLAVVLEDADAVRRRRSRATKTPPARFRRDIRAARVQRGVQQHAVDDEAHEQRLDHLEPGRDQREREEQANREAVRPQPADVVAEILPPAGLVRPGRLRDGRLPRPDCIVQLARLELRTKPW